MYHALHVSQKNRVESCALQANSFDNLNKGYCKLSQVKENYSGRERTNRVWVGPGARDLESTMAHGFVKHGFKVLLHHVVDGPLQVSRCLVLQSFNEPRSFIPGISVYFGP